MQIYNFFGINSKKVMTFWELIPEKSYFSTLNYNIGTTVIAGFVVCP